MSAATEVALIALALATLAVAATRVPGVARVFLIAQAAFWSLSYVARPLVLLWVQPDPHFGDNVPDPRLAQFGYDRGIALVLHHVVFGLWVYAGFVVAYALWARRHPPRELPALTRDPDFVPTLAAMYCVGLLGRAASIASGSIGSAGDVDSASPILSFVAILATIAALGLIIFVRPATPRLTVLIIGGLLVGELAWTAIVESKTPIIGAAMAIAVRFAILGWTRAKAIGVGVIAVLGIGGFGWLQSLKQTKYVKAEASLADSSYPPIVHPFLSILRRFDLLEAATDAYFHQPGLWLTPAETLRHASASLVPSQLLGAAKFQSGTAWAQDVRGASVDMTKVSVSLAEGNLNEGYVLGGYPGVIVCAAFTFLLLLAWAKALYSRFFPVVVLGLALTGASALFERGILGSMENLGKFLQAAVLAWLISLVVREYRRRTTAEASPAVRAPAAAPVFVGAVTIEKRESPWG
ncbi:hypothetical protein DFR70_11444 [Nocardia tenerifensis]|uniref:O-antigen polysaccharide polymerase Wzy-like protein n=1 Tax=Nocardia tenerifensis TaxID=228006 RepID=A0A318KF94_9NOCA|nr:hypothetical protein [Nocardia tenerifensis]PXX58362.1 hypothetical protein DFR70_11444 [Nocardia tenerifensis]